jgi:hypothetical protein
MADTSKSIMDAINEATVAAGGLPSGGSIVDCVRHFASVTGHGSSEELLGGNVNISNAARALATIINESDTEDKTDENV